MEFQDIFLLSQTGRRGEFTHFFLGSFRDGLRRGFFEKISLAQLEPCAKFGARFQLCRCEAPLFLVVSRINAKSLILGEKTRKTTLFVTRDFPSPSQTVRRNFEKKISPSVFCEWEWVYQHEFWWWRGR